MSSLGVVTGSAMLVLIHTVPMLIEYVASSARALYSVGVIVPDGVASPQADPLRNWAVLLLRLRKLLLRAESLVGLSTRPLVCQ